MVATDVPGCREICVNEVTGLTTKPREVDGLIEALRRLLNDEKLRKDCGRRARDLIVDKYSLEVVAKQTAGFYNAVLEADGV